MPQFDRYVGIDYSGAKTPTDGLPGLRVYETNQGVTPDEVPPLHQKPKHWTRKSLAHWLVELLAEDGPAIVGIDHGFSFPLAYFEAHGLAHDWPAFLDDFHRHWPTDGDKTRVEVVLDGSVGNGAARSGDASWRRLTEQRAGGTAKSVFRFRVNGEVAKSTHSGLPWLRFIRRELGDRVHFWPFDGWHIPATRSVLVEVYPALWKRAYPTEGRNGHQHDAYSVAAWMATADRTGELARFLKPNLTSEERATAEIEGWILGLA